MTQIDVTLGTYKAIEAARLSFTESHDDIVRRIMATKMSAKTAAIRGKVRNSPPATRKRGDVSVDLFGRSVAVANGKYAYLAILNALVRHKPSLFELLADEGTARRRWVARSAETLYAGSPHLARDHATVVHGDWFVDTNLSRKQIDQRLEIAAKLAGYRYGEDVRIVEGASA